MEKKGERIWNANTCFTAQRPHSVTLLLCHSPSAWHGAARIWATRIERNGGIRLCLACRKSFLGQAKKHKDTYCRYDTLKSQLLATFHTDERSDTLRLDEKYLWLYPIVEIFCNCTHSKMVCWSENVKSVFQCDVFFCLLLFSCCSNPNLKKTEQDYNFNW